MRVRRRACIGSNRAETARASDADSPGAGTSLTSARGLRLETVMRDFDLFAQRFGDVHVEGRAHPPHGERALELPRTHARVGLVFGQHDDGARAARELVVVRGEALARALADPVEQRVGFHDAALQRDVGPRHAPGELVYEAVLAAFFVLL